MSHLAIDTATEACSVALDTEHGRFTRFELAPREHARLCLPMMDSLLAESGTEREEIEWIAFGCGPGAFTGVRVAAGIAHGLATGLGVGLYPVSTLAALASGALAEFPAAQQVLACLDARMGEVYWGHFRRGPEGLPEAVTEECVCPPDEVPVPGRETGEAVAVGRGWSSYGEQLRARLGTTPSRIEPERFPRAEAMLDLAAARSRAGEVVMTPEQAQPVYLRDRVVAGAGTAGK